MNIWINQKNIERVSPVSILILSFEVTILRKKMYDKLQQGSEQLYQQILFEISTKFLTNIIWPIDFISVIWS